MTHDYKNNLLTLSTELYFQGINTHRRTSEKQIYIQLLLSVQLFKISNKTFTKTLVEHVKKCIMPVFSCLITLH